MSPPPTSATPKPTIVQLSKPVRGSAGPAVVLEPGAAPDAAVAVGSGSVVVAVSVGATAAPVDAGVVDGGGVAVCVEGADVVCEAVWDAVWDADCVLDPSGFVYCAQPAHEATLVAGATRVAIPTPTRIAPATTAAASRRRAPSTRASKATSHLACVAGQLPTRLISAFAPAGATLPNPGFAGFIARQVGWRSARRAVLGCSSP
jgi:hypothetical protein